MSTAYSVPDFLAAAREQKKNLGADLETVHKELALHEEREKELVSRHNAAGNEIAAALLPDIELETIAATAARCRFPALAKKDFPGQMQRERRKREERIAAIQLEPRYRDRKLLRDPAVGKLTRAIAELLEFRQPSAEIVKKCDHPRLGTLLASGYGTGQYSVPFWRASYYANWKAGDEILERFPEKKEFEEVRLEYLDAMATLQTYDSKLAELQAEVKAGEALETELAQQQDALATLEQRYLALARASLIEYLRDLPPDALGEALQEGPALGMMAKRWSGITKQIEYLDAIKLRQILPLKARIEDDIRSLDRDITKYSRPKKAFSVFPKDKFHARFVERPAKLRKHITRTSTAHTTVYSFNQYDRANLVSDFLWWDLMTDGRIDGDFIPEVKTYYAGHPGYSYQPDRLDSMASASAALASSGRTSGDLFRDAS